MTRRNDLRRPLPRNIPAFGATTGILLELEDGKATHGRYRRQAPGSYARGKLKAHGDHSTKGQMPVVPAKGHGAAGTQT